MMFPPRRKRRRPLPPGLFLAGLLVFSAAILRAQDTSDIIPEWIGEPNSPGERLTGTVTPGLSERALPVLPAPEQEESGYQPLYRLTRPYYDTLFATPAPDFLPAPDPATFRPSAINEPARGLRPKFFRPGLFEIYPFFSFAQSYDSNVNLTPTNTISDFYFTPRAGVEFQLGSPDSIYTPTYDTIFAMHGFYEGYGDIFFEHPDLSAYNQRLELTGRIGRSSAIWRPFLYASDITGSNLLLVELTNRTERVRVIPGVFGEYKLSEVIGLRQSFNYFLFYHPDPTYINFNTWNTKQELTYLALHSTKAILWAQYHYTQPDRGFAGGEYIFGTGFQGQPDPRIYTEFYIGWGALDMDGNVPGRQDLSGVRFNGYTTFDWGPRYRFTFKYDREYVFNEFTENDNYVSTLLQFRNEFYLGGNYYLTPYLGLAFNEFETSHQVTLQWRPELELAYAFADQDTPGASRIFAKIGYQNSSNIKGQGLPVTQLRLSIGWNVQF
ncbi:MAG: hypothetical protein ACREKL_09780 [Chthoniobacterales bacterium]